MWNRLTNKLACPVCNDVLALRILEEESPKRSSVNESHAAENAELHCYIRSALLTCCSCHASYPIIHGLPILVPYVTPLHSEFEMEFARRLPQSLRWPNALPPAGEER